jgi:hypothetical protein
MQAKIGLFLFLAIVVLLLVGIYPANCGVVFLHDGKELIAATSPYIRSPSNQTYDSGWLNLYVNFKGWIFGNVWFSMNYSLDGKENETVPLKSHYFGFFKITGGHPEKNYWDGFIELPVLSNGSHYLTVYLECTWETADSFGKHINRSFDSQTVHFTVVSPLVLLTRNETYNSTEIPLNFYVRGEASQIVYNLDNQANVTIFGNTTLQGFTEGLHSINIYTPDEEGHWVNYDTVTFIVTKSVPTPISSPIPFLLMGFLFIAIVAIPLLLFFRRRKAQDMSSKQGHLFKS